MQIVNYVLAKMEVMRTQMRNDERGVTAVEYGLIAALIAVVIIVAITLLGSNLRIMFDRVAAYVAAATPAAP